MLTQFADATVQPHRGAPTLFLDGRPVFPLFFMTTPESIAGMKKILPPDIHFITDSFDLGWTGVGRFDPAPFDAKMRATLAADAKAYVLPRLYIDAPADWLAANPDERVGFEDPEAFKEPNCWAGWNHASWASRPWRDAAAEALRRIIRHARQQDYAPRILGWHIGSGIYGEWHIWSGVHYPDTSKPFVHAFKAWLEERYPGEHREPRLPTIAERRRGALGMFRDPADPATRHLIDHAEFFHQVGADTLAEFARVVREETAGRGIVLAFNGYIPDLGVDCHEIDQRAYERTLRNPDVHAFSAPHTYRRRKPGQDAMIRGYLGSARATGKLWIDESDDRTFLTGESPWTHVTTREESVEVLWRAFAQAVTHGVGMWYMDFGQGWFQDRALLETLNRIAAVAAESMQKPRARVSRVAAVASFKTAFYVTDRGSGFDRLTDALVSDQLAELQKMGSPYDLYLLPELFLPGAGAGAGVPEYDVYIFLDTFHMSDADHARVKQLRDAGKTLLFFHAPGIVSDTELSVKRMTDLLGFEVTVSESMTMPDGKEHRPGLSSPLVRDGLARRGNVFWSPAAPLPASRLREALRAANAHEYFDSDDVLMAGCGYIGIHAASAGDKTLRNPEPARWTDVRTREVVARDATAVTLRMSRGQTALLELTAR